MERWRLREIFEQSKKVLWFFVPNSIQEKVRKRVELKKAAYEIEVFQNHRVSEQEVYAAMEKLDIHGDVMIHSSLVEIGNIQGRHMPFVKYLKERILDNGHTILAIAIPIKGYTEDYLSKINRFDKDAPIAMGIMSTYYARQNGAMRSLSPTHSVVALGARANDYTAMHHLDMTPFSINSPFYKLLVNNGTVLMLGANIKHMTLAHLIEDMLGDLYPKKIYEKKPHMVDIYKDGACVYKGEYFAHSKWMSAFQSDIHMVECMRALPSTKVVKLGAGEIVSINAREAVVCLLEELKKGNSIWGRAKVSEECRMRIDYWISKINKMPNE